MNRYDQDTVRAEAPLGPSLRLTLDSIDKNIDHAHARIDEIEDRLLSPRPRTAQGAGNAVDAPAPHPGVRTVALSLEGETSRLCARLNELLEQI